MNSHDIAAANFASTTDLRSACIRLTNGAPLHMGIVAKRVEHVPHSDPTKIVIKSINPEYQTYEREAEEVNIVGRVIWAAKRL